MNPKTLQEWEIYVRQLAGQALWSKAIAANTQRFVDSLLGDGLTMAEARHVILFFVRQLAHTGMKVPDEGVFDMVGMAETDSFVMRGQVLDPKVVAEMAANVPSEEDLEDAWDAL